MRIMPSIVVRNGLVLLTCTLFAPPPASPQTFGGVGERAQGMAGAFVAVADDATAIYWNPAGLPTGSNFDAQFGWTSGPRTGADPSARRGFAGASMPAFGVAYYRVRSA